MLRNSAAGADRLMSRGAFSVATSASAQLSGLSAAAAGTSPVRAPQDAAGTAVCENYSQSLSDDLRRSAFMGSPSRSARAVFCDLSLKGTSDAPI